MEMMVMMIFMMGLKHESVRRWKSHDSRRRREERYDESEIILLSFMQSVLWQIFVVCLISLSIQRFKREGWW